jgi:hypothetical protein
MPQNNWLSIFLTANGANFRECGSCDFICEDLRYCFLPRMAQILANGVLILFAKICVIDFCREWRKFPRMES